MFESHEITKTISESKTKFLWLTMAIAYVALSLVLLLEVRGRINSLETAQMTTNSTLHALAQRSDAEDSTMQARTNALAEQLGMTQKTLQ